ncbi:hydantoinase B/oxoprolinase family protein [Sphingomonas canadensis]|uniref:Hydantoinase B/oxoprolinase family protein n=1 Tax=Sphingomonas canadensis TaxID=1219257 RepID=A0ABW3H2G9_9SPHN|nr:hydantoinase B/oxoprolinase family protein [Sphingomonas canadensis]MCW3834527.1 hydantoinase B/oxoprolinase family protein [Sphingomonas canadensis]
MISQPALSGARLAVLRSRMDGISRKMSKALTRAGRSGVLNRAKDLSCAILSPECALLSAADSLPIHVLSGPDLMARSMLDAHPELRRGDAFLHNCPYTGCSHAADHTILVPVIDDEGRHRFTVLVKAHQADIGDSAPTTYFAGARDVYEEGALIFPAVQVQRDYRIIDDIVRMCRARIRVPDQWYGDFLAMIGAARCGEQELLDLGAEVGWDVLDAFSQGWLAYGERQMRDRIAGLPALTASGSSRHDPMPGTPADGVEVRATVRIDPGAHRIIVDLTDNIDVLPCGLNVSEACARTGALIGIFNTLGAGVVKNAGSIGRVEILLRDGSCIGGGRHPTSFSVSTTNLADRIVAAVQIAVSEVLPEMALAETGAVNPPHKGVVSGIDPRDGRAFINQLFLGSTGGAASARADAWLTYSHAGNAGMSFVDSIEMVEMHHPLRVLRRELVPDSEGAGEHTGAPALTVELEPIGAEIEIAYVSDGTINRAQGVCGGAAAGAAAQAKRTQAGVVDLPPFGHLRLRPGEALLSVGTGGGGFGDPRRRDPAKVCEDVRDRRISRQRAWLTYGVAIGEDGAIDARATTELRTKGPSE